MTLKPNLKVSQNALYLFFCIFVSVCVCARTSSGLGKVVAPRSHSHNQPNPNPKNNIKNRQKTRIKRCPFFSGAVSSLFLLPVKAKNIHRNFVGISLTPLSLHFWSLASHVCTHRYGTHSHRYRYRAI